MGVISLGLSEIQVGDIAADGGCATVFNKIGKTYQNTCKISQDSADVTEHYEEGQSAPEVRKKKKKVPVLAFSIMDPDTTFLKAYLGGTVTGDGDDADGDKIKVADKPDAIEYLKERFPEKGYTAVKLRTKTAFDAACKECGVEFVFTA